MYYNNLMEDHMSIIIESGALLRLAEKLTIAGYEDWAISEVLEGLLDMEDAVEVAGAILAGTFACETVVREAGPYPEEHSEEREYRELMRQELSLGDFVAVEIRDKKNKYMGRLGGPVDKWGNDLPKMYQDKSKKWHLLPHEQWAVANQDKILEATSPWTSLASALLGYDSDSVAQYRSTLKKAHDMEADMRKRERVSNVTHSGAHSQRDRVKSAVETERVERADRPQDISRVGLQKIPQECKTIVNHNLDDNGYQEDSRGLRYSIGHPEVEVNAQVIHEIEKRVIAQWDVSDIRYIQEVLNPDYSDANCIFTLHTAHYLSLQPELGRRFLTITFYRENSSIVGLQDMEDLIEAATKNCWAHRRETEAECEARKLSEGKSTKRARRAIEKSVADWAGRFPSLGQYQTKKD